MLAGEQAAEAAVVLQPMVGIQARLGNERMLVQEYIKMVCTYLPAFAALSTTCHPVHPVCHLCCQLGCSRGVFAETANQIIIVSIFVLRLTAAKGFPDIELNSDICGST